MEARKSLPKNLDSVLLHRGYLLLAGKEAIDWTQYLLAVKDRKLGGITTAPDGLYLGAVYYPEHYGIAKHPVFNKLPENTQRHVWD